MRVWGLFRMPFLQFLHSNALQCRGGCDYPARLLESRRPGRTVVSRELAERRVLGSGAVSQHRRYLPAAIQALPRKSPVERYAAVRYPGNGKEIWLWLWLWLRRLSRAQFLQVAATQSPRPPRRRYPRTDLGPSATGNDRHGRRERQRLGGQQSLEPDGNYSRN